MRQELELERRTNQLAYLAHRQVDEVMPVKEDTPHDSRERGIALTYIEDALARGLIYRRCYGAHGRVKSIDNGRISLEPQIVLGGLRLREDILWSYMVGQCLRASTGDGSDASHQYKDGVYEVYWIDYDKKCFGVASPEGLEVGDYLFLVPNPRFAAAKGEVQP